MDNIEENTQDMNQMALEFPSRLLVMLYDDALENLEVLQGAIEADDIEARFQASERVAEILYQLCLALDMENGGDIAANLAALYKHGIQQMTEINFSNDASIAAALIQILEPLRASWAELDERIRAAVDQAENMMMDPAFLNEFVNQGHQPMGAELR